MHTYGYMLLPYIIIFYLQIVGQVWKDNRRCIIDQLIMKNIMIMGTNLNLMTINREFRYSKLFLKKYFNSILFILFLHKRDIYFYILLKMLSNIKFKFLITEL